MYVFNASYDEVPMDVCMYKVYDVVQYVWSWYFDGCMDELMNVCMYLMDDVAMDVWMY